MFDLHSYVAEEKRGEAIRALIVAGCATLLAQRFIGRRSHGL